MLMSIYENIALRIIKEQELLMGPIAWLEAGKVSGLKIVDREKEVISIEDSNAATALNGLTDRFEKLFGRTGREVCKEAAAALVADLQPSQIPANLL